MLEKIFNSITKIKRVFFPFYKDKELKFVFQKLQEGFPNDKIVTRFVGGCVRKHLSNDDIESLCKLVTKYSKGQKRGLEMNDNLKLVLKSALS